MKQIVKATTKKEISDREKLHASLAREAALEGFVLLKNDGVLPIKPQRVALYGSGARMTVVGGSGSGAMNQRYQVSIENGLENASYQVTTKNYLDRFDTYYNDCYTKWKNGIEEVGRKPEMMGNPFALIVYATENSFLYPTGISVTDDDIQASQSDIAIYVLSRQAGEGMDRKNEKGDFKMDDTEIANLKKISENYKKVLLVINVGGVVDLSPIDGMNIGAILFYTQGGMEGGNAFADIVSGKVSPSGKLACTWANKYEDYPSHDTFSTYGDTKQQDYKEGIFIGYRYFDSFDITPRYEFGHGLSYTSFEISTKNEREENGCIAIDVTIKNTGSYAGKEVVQLYVSAPHSKNQEYQRLVAFKKTKLLHPNECESFVMRFKLADCASYYPSEKKDGKGNWLLSKGVYIIRIGTSSKNTRIAVGFDILKDVCTETCDDVCVPKTAIKEFEANVHEDILPNGIKVLPIDCAHIQTVNHIYSKLPVYGKEISARVKETIEKMSVDELATLVTGPGTHHETLVTVLGVSGNTTCSLYEKYGIPNVTLSDGPAGLNVTPEIVQTESGEVKSVNMYPQYDFGLFGQILRSRLGKPEDGVMHYQYATAWPVAILLAQTWNEDLIEKVGEAIGTEMQELGVTVWLAPGMNLYRNPLCGRVFEYYSEDPLVSGKIAAAITRGVQSKEGCFVSVKHFACNNQEFDRGLSSSNLSERALRELYLKTFGIVVEEAKPRTVMASYNKINQLYSTNNYDLLVKVLRNEWGFEGLVISDWNAVDIDRGNPVLAMQAQCDLMMPGKPELKNMVIDGVDKGILSLDDLKRCAARVLQLVSENIVAKF